MKIGVVGSINMDMVITAEKIPAKGETIRGNNISYYPGGKGANQAVAASKLGGNIIMLGAVGNDDNGRNLISSLKDKGINTDFIKIIDNENTGLAVITVGSNDNTIIVISGTNSLVDIGYIDSIKDEILSCGMIVIQNEILDETNQYVINLCKKNGIKTLLNPAPARALSDEIIKKIDYIIPNEHEANFIFGNNFEKKFEIYKEKLIVTLGEDGVQTCLNNGTLLSVSCRKSNVVDTTGAGDTFIGAFTFATCKGYSINDALKFANIAAGISTEKKGAQSGMPLLEQILKEMEV